MKRFLLTFICSLVFVGCFKNKSNESALKDQKAAFAEKNEKQVTVQFGGTVNPGVPMEFRPLVRALKVTTGESNLVKYRFSNLSDKPLEIVAVHSVMPEGAAQFFKKIVCFCFEKQTLEPKQTVDMDVNFTVAKELPAEIDTIGLSYVVHEVKKDAAAL